MTNPFALTKTDRDVAKVAATPPPPPRACSKCSGSIGAGNKSGVCTPCQKPNRKRAGRAPLVLNRAGFLRDDVSPVREEATQVPAEHPEIPLVTELLKVAGTLGLNGPQILSDFANAWLDRVLAAAHAAAEGPKVEAPPASPPLEASP